MGDRAKLSHFVVM